MQIAIELRDKMMELAYEAMERAYAPYSGYKVGACLLTKSGKLYQGCNIENAGFTPTVCAERTAIFKAVYDGEYQFEAVAVVGNGDKWGYPCGVCRQVMAEFCNSDFHIYVGDAERRVTEISFGELLPNSFGPGAF